MKAEEAFEWLSSVSPHRRLQGARHFLQTRSQQHLPKLRDALKRERVSYVVSALELAIQRNTAGYITASSPKIPLEMTMQITPSPSKFQAEKWAGILLHEIEPKVGLVRLAAQREIPDFSQSDTFKYLESLDRILNGFVDLRKSVATPRADEFDLAELIKTTAEIELNGKREVRLNGPQPYLIQSDKNLLHMAVSNGLRNAVEAMSNTTADEPIVISWGRDDTDHHITILDSGPGIVGQGEGLFQVGNTSKTGHGGFGLAIIKQALENLDGHSELLNAHSGGAKLLLRWRAK